MNPNSPPLECIIFSKDRMLQLHALLSSYQENFSTPPPAHLIYRGSNEAYLQAYIQLFKERKFSFLKTIYKQSRTEQFQPALVDLLQSIEAPRVLFLVDDDLIINKIEVSDLLEWDLNKVVPSLRLGQHLTRCYMSQKGQPLPPFLTNIATENKLYWNWSEGLDDWGYPLSVTSHIFSTKEILNMTRAIKFSAPNSYESHLQRFNRHRRAKGIFNIFRSAIIEKPFKSRYGVCYKETKILNIPCNKTQVENSNQSGSLHQDDLLNTWQAGLQINYRKFYGIANISAHQEVTFEYIQRS